MDTTKAIDTITERLHAKADAKLEQGIEDLFKGLYVALYNDTLYKTPTFSPGTNWYGVLAILKKALFSGLCERARKEEIVNFLNEVENLKAQVEDMQNRIM